MDRNRNLHRRTEAALEQGSGDTDRLATEWAMPFIPDDGSNSPTDVPFTPSRRPQRRVGGCVTFFGRLLMLFGLVVLLGGVFAGFNLLGRDAHRTTAPKVYPVTGIPTVQIENSIGNVDVLVGRSDQVQVVADVEVRHISQGLAEQAVEGYSLDVDDSTPGTIKIHASDRNPFTGDDIFAGWLAHRSVSLTVMVPANSNLEFDVAAGRMNAEGITGKVHAVVRAGSVNLVNMNLADGSSFEVYAGSLYFSGALQTDASLDVQVNAGSADLELPRLTDAFLDANASAGNVRATGWTGPISRERNGDDNMSITGYLTSNTSTKSRITATVHAGSVDISGQSERTFEPEPSLPPLPSLPPAPSAPPSLPGR
jgi:hypothetical protein